MRELPILFSGEMVRAILAGRKTMTRRLVTPQPDGTSLFRWRGKSWTPADWRRHISEISRFRVGRRMWVRETWADLSKQRSENGVVGAFKPRIIYAADQIEIYGELDDPERVNVAAIRWRPSIHMPRAASRLALVVTAHRVEKLQEITEADARAEGVEPDPHVTADHYRIAFGRLWNALNGKRAPLLSNPLVEVVSFQIESVVRDGMRHEVA